MKILVVGSGGREHALAWKLAQSEKTEKIFVAPGNGGTATETKCENFVMAADPASVEGQETLREFALREKIDLTVIGPELPLAMGIADTFRAAGLAVVGPGKQAAQLEASKIYSKAFMAKYGVRAASGSSFTDFEKARVFAREYFQKKGSGEWGMGIGDRGSGIGIRTTGVQPGSNIIVRTTTPVPCSPIPDPPLVIKADGLAAGKGVVIARDFAEAEEALAAFMRDKSLGEAGTSALLEEFLEGKEVSVLAAVSVSGGGGYILPFIAARDHKRRFEGAQGPNTGGMGAIAPVPDFSPAAEADFIKSILKPTLNGMIAEGFEYRGFIFFGLMVHENSCRLLEYNVRLGDPETQAVLPLMDFDLADLCDAVLAGRDFPLAWKKGAVCVPVAVAEGYPGPYRKGDAITINAAALEKTGAKVFVSGAVPANGESGETPSLRTAGLPLLTAGGRVLTVSALGANADEARANAYKGLEAISFDGMGFRRDIGKEE